MSGTASIEISGSPSVRVEIANPYSEAYSMFEGALRMLEELNKHLPGSIRQMKGTREQALKKKIKKLGDEAKAECDRALEAIMRLYEEEMKGKKMKPGKQFQFSLSPDAEEIFYDTIQTVVFPNRFNVFVRDMSLVYLIAEFESFLRDVLEISFKKRPEILSSSEKSVKYEDLVKRESIDDIIQEIVEKEILSIINQDIERINNYFETKFNTKLSQFTNWKQFKERFYRRNVIVHNSSIPNQLYRLKTGYKGKDKRLEVSEDYLDKSIKLFRKIGLKISGRFHEKFK